MVENLKHRRIKSNGNGLYSLAKTKTASGIKVHIKKLLK